MAWTSLLDWGLIVGFLTYDGEVADLGGRRDGPALGTR